jgi:hypothetical protein
MIPAMLTATCSADTAAACAAGKRSSKAVCVQPAKGLLHELWLDVVNLDTILLDPEALMAGAAAGAAAAGLTGSATLAGQQQGSPRPGFFAARQSDTAAAAGAAAAAQPLPPL